MSRKSVTYESRAEPNQRDLRKLPSSGYPLVTRLGAKDRLGVLENTELV